MRIITTAHCSVGLYTAERENKGVAGDFGKPAYDRRELAMP